MIWSPQERGRRHVAGTAAPGTRGEGSRAADRPARRGLAGAVSALPLSGVRPEGATQAPRVGERERIIRAFPRSQGTSPRSAGRAREAACVGRGAQTQGWRARSDPGWRPAPTRAAVGRGVAFASRGQEEVGSRVVAAVLGSVSLRPSWGVCSPHVSSAPSSGHLAFQGL